MSETTIENMGKKTSMYQMDCYVDGLGLTVHLHFVPTKVPFELFILLC